MKIFATLILLLFSLSGCAHGYLRLPQSVPKSRTLIQAGTRIILKQPIPFINNSKEAQVIDVDSRSHFVTNENVFFCHLSANVPRQDYVFLNEGTSLVYKESSLTGETSYFESPNGIVGLSCMDMSSGESRSNLSIEEVQLAFPKDVLILEKFFPGRIASEKR